MIDEKKYIESQAQAAGVVTSNDLVCKHCKYRNDSMPTSHCNAYKTAYKPDAVLLGRGCPMFRRK